MPEEPSRLDITASNEGDNRILRLRGELDPHTAPELEAALHEQPNGVSRVVIDLAGVHFVDSSGLRVFVAAHEQLTAAGTKLILRSPSGTVQRLLDLTGLAEHLEVDEQG